jgi:hypothetical protein
MTRRQQKRRKRQRVLQADDRCWHGFWSERTLRPT